MVDVRVNRNKTHWSEGCPIPNALPCCISNEGWPMNETKCMNNDDEIGRAYQITDIMTPGAGVLRLRQGHISY